MSIPGDVNESGGEFELLPERPMPAKPVFSGDILDPRTWRRFLNLTGGSVFYCLSAVCTAYGIVNVLGPALSQGEGLREALPCILTLHLYELALLGVLVLIVHRKVVDDAISIVVLIALFLVGTSMALGSVADKGITLSLYLGLLGAALAFGKFCSMRRFTRIPLAALSTMGLLLLITSNYMGPVIMARTISIDPSDESARRGVWLLVWLAMLIGGGLVILEAVKCEPRSKAAKDDEAPFLQRPVMAYVFALIVLVGSGVHQYAMAFTFALERALGDFVPVITVSTFLTLEILRRRDKRFGVAEIAISCVPLAATMLAIQHRMVLASGEIGVGLLCYPPVALGLSGLGIAALAVYHRWHPLKYVVLAYGLGVILTAGFSPESPHNLNVRACVLAFVIALLAYGAIRRDPNVCLAAILITLLGVSRTDGLSAFATSHGLTVSGAMFGAFGLGCMVLWLLFADQLHRGARITGVLCLAAFTFDYLPEYVHWRYLFVLVGTGLLTAGLWSRTRDILLMLILCAPFLARLYMMARRIAHWRLVILGFVLLGAGVVASLFKQRLRPDDKSRDVSR
ncbi:MAG: hypothetical protein ACYSWQ_27915 [Planctomycetota bacterium]|jgi:hypothetical protein